MVGRRPQRLQLLLHLQHLRAMIHRYPAEAFVAALAAGTSVVEIAAEVGIAAEVETAADGTAAECSVEETQQPAPPDNRSVAVDAGWLAKEVGKDRTEAVVTDAEAAELSKQLAVAALVPPSSCEIAGP